MPRHTPKHSEVDTHQPDYLTPDAVSALIGFSVHTLAHWRLEGRGPAYHRIGDVGRNCRVLYARADVDDWIGAHRRTTSDARADTLGPQRRPERRSGRHGRPDASRGAE